MYISDHNATRNFSLRMVPYIRMTYLGLRCAVLRGRVRKSVIRREIVVLYFRSSARLHRAVPRRWASVIRVGH